MASTCVGDCKNNDTVDISDLVVGVNIALGVQQLAACPAFDCMHDGTVTVTCLVQGVNNALLGCGFITPTPTITGLATATPGTTPSNCPLQAGKYTITSQNGGILRVATFAPFAFPPFGTIVADVSAGDTNCIHSTVIPFPGGFTSPVFCVPALEATTSVVQTACGIGQIDSDGGSDYTVTELGDTSFTSTPPAPTCDIKQATCPGPGPAPDSSILVRVKVGDGTPDACVAPAKANMIASIPVFTMTWVKSNECPDTDGKFDMGTDTLLAQFPQILDFTTDTNTAQFMDLDGDGCFKSGLGPIGPFMNSGTCGDISKFNMTKKECKKGTNTGMHADCTSDSDCGANGPCSTGACYKDARVHCDVDADCKECLGTAVNPNPTFCTSDGDCPVQGGMPTAPCIAIAPCSPLLVPAVTTAASGTIGSSGGPTYDLLFTTILPNGVSGPEPLMGATCATPPEINFTGTVDRCIQGQ